MFRKTILTVLAIQVFSLSADAAASKIYWTEPGEGPVPKVRRCNPDGTDVETVVGGGLGVVSPRDITIDPIGGKIYWIDDIPLTGVDKIQRANLDGSNIEDVLSSASSFFGLAVDPQAQKIYWTSSAGAIFRSDLDGSNREEVIDQIGPHGITLHLAAPGHAPAVGTLGIAMMVGMMIAVGGWVFGTRGFRRRATATTVGETNSCHP